MKSKEKQKTRLSHTDCISDPAVSPVCCYFLLQFILVYTVIIQSCWLFSPHSFCNLHQNCPALCCSPWRNNHPGIHHALPWTPVQLMGTRETKVGGCYLRVWSGGFAVDTCIHPSSASQRSSMKLSSGKDTIQEEPVPNAVMKWLKSEVWQ